MPVTVTPGTTNIIKVRLSDIGSLQVPGSIPTILHGTEGSSFQFNNAANGDILVFDSDISKFKNVPLSGDATINTSGVMTVTHIDGGTF